MKRLLPILSAALLISAISLQAATVIVKISQFPNTTAPANTDLFLLASAATNKNITWNQLKDAIGTNPATVTILNNLYVSNVFTTNLYASNIYTTNLTVLNEFHGKTSFITNIYTTQIVTNYFLFSTNLYQEYPTYINNSYVSNYFQTNAFNNTYVSNYFNTNAFNYFTNLYQFSTNLTVTNFYLNDTYISNFFNTNIFNVDNTVSNFFATNLYNTINITSNYTYLISANLTNPTIAGQITSIGSEQYSDPRLQMYAAGGGSIVLDTKGTPSITVSGGSPGVINLISNGVETVTIDANGGAVKAYTLLSKSLVWGGPTNNLPLTAGEFTYTANSDCNITNISNLPSDGYAFGTVLKITNSASTNITLRFPATVGIPERTTSVTISNASRGMLSLGYSSVFGTNGVYRQF